jgi:hypothetical protein
MENDAVDGAAEKQLEWNREQLRRNDESYFEQRFARLARNPVHNFVPAEWFAAAATECREMFRDGHFYGCISVAQAVGETLATQFLVDQHPRAEKQQEETWAEAWLRAGVITERCCQAFLRIRKNRNDFHHLNKGIPTDRVILERRAEECVKDLYDIESEIFAYEISSQGTLIRQRPEYWIEGEPNLLQVFLRQAY